MGIVVPVPCSILGFSDIADSSFCLITVVSGESYERYADELFASAKLHLRATDPEPIFLKLPGRPGWPDATMYRYHTLLEHQERIPEGFAFLSDADMLFENRVGAEILPRVRGGVTATLHPGFVGKPRPELPYEYRSESRCRIRADEGVAYYCGGFVGGDRAGLLQLASGIVELIDADRKHGVVPVWHDESALNRVLASRPPDVTLSPAYCHPDKDEPYRSWWPDDYARLLVALDKPSSEREERDRVEGQSSPARVRMRTVGRLRARLAGRLRR